VDAVQAVAAKYKAAGWKVSVTGSFLNVRTP
jgi:hypothetical protein